MKKVEIVKQLEQLAPYINDKGIIEIVTREKNKRYKKFINIALGENGEEAREGLKKIAEAVVNNKSLMDQCGKAADAALKVSQFGAILGVVNICATVVGTVIIYQELKKMENKINVQLEGIQANIKDAAAGNLKNEYNEALSEHMDMMDRRSRRRGQLFSEDEMRKLVDKECNVLEHLVDALKKEYVSDIDSMIFVTMSLLSMYTTSLCYYDEQSYFNNRTDGNQSNPWHLSHDRWMKVFDYLSENWFIELLQDNAMFNSNSQVTTSDVDLYYKGIIEQVKDMSQTVVDNMYLIQKLDNKELLGTFQEKEDQEFVEELKGAYAQIYGSEENEETQKSFNEALKIVIAA